MQSQDNGNTRETEVSTQISPQSDSIDSPSPSAVLDQSFLKTDFIAIPAATLSDYENYAQYLDALVEIEGRHIVEIEETKDEREWFKAKMVEANSLLDAVGGSASRAELPIEPSQSIVNISLQEMKLHVDRIPSLKGEIDSLRNQITEKQKEIDDRNRNLVIGTVVYIIGAFICGAITKSAAAALLWPLVVVVAGVALAVFGMFN
jgi:hypothetical protein